MQEFEAGLLVPEPIRDDSSSIVQVTNVQINDTDEKHAVIFQIPKSGTVEGGVVNFTAVTTGGDVFMRLETLDAATGNPSGTLYHANSSGTFVLGDDDDNTGVEFDFNGSFAVSKGDFVALVLVHSSTGNYQVTLEQSRIPNFPLIISSISTSGYTKAAQTGTMVLRYNDDTYSAYPSIFPFTTVTAHTFGSGSTPDEVGARVKFPFQTLLTGIHFVLSNSSSGDFDVCVYDTDGASTMTYVSFDGNYQQTTSGSYKLLFKDAVTLNANQYYRVVFRPTTATTILLQSYNMETDAIHDSFPYGADFHLTTAKDPDAEGDWTNTTTARPAMGLILSGVSQ